MELMCEVWMSFLTLLTIYLTGDQHKWAPLMGLFAELFWGLWIIVFEHYGLIPLNICLIFMYIRMFFKWKKKICKVSGQATDNIV